MAYRKQALCEIGGFAALPDSLSGDDDFVLQAVSRHPSWQVGYAFNPNTVVPATGPQNLRRFLLQKKRHISAGKHYSRTAQLGFALYHLVNLILWCTAIAGFFITPLFFMPLFLKFVFDYVVLRYFLGQFKMTIHLGGFVLWEFFFAFYNTVMGPISILSKITW